MYRIRKLFEFEAAHVLPTAVSQDCTEIHGHSYKVEVFLTANELDGHGMVVDFGWVKKHLGDVVEQLDHSFLVGSCEQARKFKKIMGSIHKPIRRLCRRDTGGCSATAENMAAHLFWEMRRRCFIDCDNPRGIKLEKVRVHETRTGWAEYWYDANEEEAE